MLKTLSEFYEVNLNEQELLIKELKILLADSNLENSFKIIQYEATNTKQIKMLDLLHDINKFLEEFEHQLNQYVKSFSSMFKVRCSTYNTISFYVQEDVGSMSLLGEYNLFNNTYKNHDDLLLEKERINQKYNDIEKNIAYLKQEKEMLEIQKEDLTKISVMLKKDQRINGDIYEIDRKLNKYLSEKKNFNLQYKNLHQLFKNMQLYYRLLEGLKELGIKVNQTIFIDENHYNVFMYTNDEEKNERKTSIIKKHTDTYDSLKDSNIATDKVFLSLDVIAKKLPEGMDYVKKENYLDIELDFTVYRFYEHGLITIDNIYGNIYDLFDIGIFDIIEESCNALVLSTGSYL